jgi:AcrR family transcriptional regulator
MLTLSTLFCESIVVAPKKRTAAYHHGNLRAALIDAGLGLIQEKGIRALTLREIGARLGVSRSAAYRHFADKSALLEAIAEAGFIEFAEAQERAKRRAAPNFTARLAAMGEAYVRFANRRRAHFEVMFSAPLKPGTPAAEAGGRAFAVLEQTIREGQQSGDVRSGDSNLIAQSIWAWVHGISVLRMDTLTPGFLASSFEILRFGFATPEARGTSADRTQGIPTRSVDSPSAA